MGAENCCRFGPALAQYNLGVLYEYGYGGPQDFAAAASWYRKAAEQGHANAQRSIGGMYDRGQGVTQDYVQAHKWFNIAAATGDPGAMNTRNLVAAKMTPAQIAEAQKLASKWKPGAVPRQWWKFW